MRWKLPKKGDEKTKRLFLFFPQEIGSEIRWLELAKIRFVFGEKEVEGSGGKRFILTDWIATEFM